MRILIRIVQGTLAFLACSTAIYAENTSAKQAQVDQLAELREKHAICVKAQPVRGTDAFNKCRACGRYVNVAGTNPRYLEDGKKACDAALAVLNPETIQRAEKHVKQDQDVRNAQPPASNEEMIADFQRFAQQCKQVASTAQDRGTKRRADQCAKSCAGYVNNIRREPNHPRNKNFWKTCLRYVTSFEQQKSSK